MRTTRDLAALVVADSPFAMSTATRAAMSTAVLNALATGASASGDPRMLTLASAAEGLGGLTAAHLLGRGEEVSAAAAAFVNGAAIQLGEPAELQRDPRMEFSAPVIASALAAAQSTGASIEELFEAIHVGAEISLRVARGLGDSHVRRGWCPIGSAGVVGAAAAAARVLRIGEPATLMALGIAATQAAGLRRAAGSVARPVASGKAAMNGLEAAMLAGDGMTASPVAIEGSRGLGECMSDGPDYQSITEDLGQRWMTEETRIGLHACSAEAQSVVEAVVRASSGRVEAISAIVVTVHPQSHDFLRFDHPRDGLEARFSIPHLAAVAALDGAAGESAFTDARCADLHVARLRHLTEVRRDDHVAVGDATAEVHFSHRRSALETVNVDRLGLSTAAVHAKAETLLRSVGADSATAIRLCMQPNSLASSRELALACVSAPK